MTDAIALPTALDALEGSIRSAEPLDGAHLGQILRVLQRFGLSQQDIVVHLERMRLQNELGPDLEEVEENALLALELVSGATQWGLSWDAKEIAAAWVPRALQHGNLSAGATYALSASDLLPARPDPQHGVSLVEQLVSRQWERVARREYHPSVAEFFRSPKDGLTTRPAALLAPQDRLIYEALVESVAASLSVRLPEHVHWPRDRSPRGDHASFTQAPKYWNSTFVIRTDIARYYESIDHAFLGLLVSEKLDLGGALPIALEAFLDSVMGASAGLPQGPPGSDLLGSAYLIDIDAALQAAGWECARYADDMLIGAESFSEARAQLRVLEAMLRERGLHLSNEKTRIVRRNTYVRNLDKSSTRSAFSRAVEEEVKRWIEAEPESQDIDEVLRGFGVPEELLWDLLYHETISIKQALAQVRDRLMPAWVSVYSRFLASEGRRLLAGGYADDPGALSTRDLRECLLLMTGGESATDFAALHAILDWHPTLVRDIAAYLAAVAETQSGPVTDFLRERIDAGRDSDLELGWLLSSVIESPSLGVSLRPHLERVALGDKYSLASAVATRGLAASSLLSEDVWLQAVEGASDPMQAELLLAREANPDGFPAGLEQLLEGPGQAGDSLD